MYMRGARREGVPCDFEDAGSLRMETTGNISETGLSGLCLRQPAGHIKMDKVRKRFEVSGCGEGGNDGF